MSRLVRRLISLIALLVSAAGCGGGGSAGFSPPPPPPPSSGWQPGVFMDADTFYARCQSPRSGTNPATGLPYPDIQGTTTDENNFLRSYSNDTYLWYDEITDRDPGLYNDPLNYFGLLKTTATTPSGAAKDKFHFTYDTQEWYQLFQVGESFGYGMQVSFLSTYPPREAVVAYTEPGTPATSSPANIVRGATLVSIDGADVANGNAAVLNAGLFPSSENETHTFEVQDLGSQSTRTFDMTSAKITSAPVQNVHIINTATGDVGYMLFNDHLATAEQALIDGVNALINAGGVDDLVLDLRYNGGGYLAIASELAYMIAGPGPTAGETFERIQFNNKHPITNPVTGQAIQPMPFYTTTLGPPFNGNNGSAGAALPSLNLSRVFVLTGPDTCSASESVINSLRGVNVQVIQVGSTTCGKPYGFYDTDNCGTTYFTIQFRGVNAKDFGDYTDGFSPNNTAGPAGTIVPGCSVADDFDSALGDPTEMRLAAALSYRDGNACPTASGLGPGMPGKPGAPLGATDGIILKSPWLMNRIMRR